MARRLSILLFVITACEDASFSRQDPELSVAADPIDFGEVFIGGNKIRTLELHALRSPLVIEARLAGTAFRSASSVKIAAGARATLELTFVPIELGSATATLTLSAAGLETRQIRLYGSGLQTPSCEDTNDCTIDEFDFAQGSCTHRSREGDCDDHSACTEADRCENGQCVGRAIRCDDEIDCTRDVCDPAIGCAALPRDEVCADDDPCTIDRCENTGCENRVAPDGTLCGDVVACQTAEICILQRCIEVDIPEGAPCDDGSACTAGDRCNAGLCSGVPNGRVPEIVSETYTLPLANSAALIDGEIYASSYIDPWFPREERVYKFAIDGARATAVARPVEGHAQFTEFDANTLARVGTSSSGIKVELLAKNTLTLIDSIETRLTPPAPRFSGVQAVAGGRIFLCAGQQLASVRFSSRSPQIHSGLSPCGPPFEAAVSRGEFIVGWYRGAGSWVPGYTVFGLDSSGPRSLLDFGFNHDGVSRYGRIVDVAMDQTRALVDIENPSWFFSIDLQAQRHGRVSISLPAPALLLGLEQQIAYFHAGSELRAVDLADYSNPQVMSWRLPLTANSVKIIASDPQQLLLQTQEGLQLVPAAGSTRAVVALASGGIDRAIFTAGGVMAFGQSGAALDRDLFDERFYFSAVASRSIATDDLLGARGAALRPLADLPALLAGCDRTAECSTTSSAGPEIRRFLAENGLQEQSPLLIDPAAGALRAFDAAGCTGVGLGEQTIEVLDRCRTPAFFASVASLALPAGVERPSRIVSQETRASLLAPHHAWLVDHRSAPRIAAEAEISDALILGANSDGARWILTLLRNGRGVIRVISGSVYRELDLPQIDRGAGRVLRIEWPLVWIAAPDALLVLDLSGNEAAVFAQIATGTPPLSTTHHNGLDVVVRRDGYSLLTPICD